MSALADRVLKITTAYLGPAARVFLERQTKGHLGGLALSDVREEHLPRLFFWIEASSALLINEKSALLVAQLKREFHVSNLER